MNRSILLVLLAPIAFVAVGYSCFEYIPKYAIGLSLLVVLVALLSRVFALRLSGITFRLLLVNLCLLSVGLFGLIESPYVSAAPIGVGLEYGVFVVVFLLSIEQFRLELRLMVRMFQVAVLVSLAFFYIDTFLLVLFGSAFVDDLGVLRFSPSLGPSAGAIYLLMVFVALVGLPRITARHVHSINVGAVAMLILLTSTRIALIAMVFVYIYLSSSHSRVGKLKFDQRVVGNLIKICLFVACLFLLVGRLFFEGGGVSVDAINTNGRIRIWEAFILRASERIWFGYGWGASNTFITRTGLGEGFGVQPHSDYVRLIFEVGVIGLSLFVISCWFAWRALGGVGLCDFKYRCDKTARAYLLVLGVLMLTDNVFIYHFYTYPALLFVCLVVAGRVVHESKYSSSSCNQYTRTLSD